MLSKDPTSIASRNVEAYIDILKEELRKMGYKAIWKEDRYVLEKIERQK